MESIFSSTIFRTHQYIIAVAIIILVNIRYVVCNIFDFASLPCTILITLLLLLGIDYTRIAKKILLQIFIFLCIVAIHFNAISILTFVLFCSICNYSFRSLLWINLLTMLLLVGFSIVLFLLGITKDHVIINLIKEGHTLGFSNPNVLSLYIYAFLLNLYALINRKFIIPVYFIMLTVAYVTYLYSASRTCFIGVLAIAAADLLIRILPKSVVANKYVLYSVPIILSVLSIYFCIDWQNYFTLDVILSGRLSIMGSILNNLTPIEYLVGFNWPENIPQDNAYITLLSTGGILAFILYFYYYSIYIGTLQSAGIHSLPLIASVLLCGLTEYVFVGLNMVSITLVLVVKNSIQNASSVSHTSRLQCSAIS